MTPFPPLVPLFVRFGREAAGVSSPSPHRLLSAPGVPRTSTSSSTGSSWFKPLSLLEKDAVSPPLRLENAVPEGGEGVDTGAVDGAVVSDVADGTRRLGLAGVEKPEAKDPREISGCVPLDSIDVS